MKLTAGMDAPEGGIKLCWVTSGEGDAAGSIDDERLIRAHMRKHGAVNVFKAEGTVGLGSLGELRLDRLRAAAGEAARALRDREYREASLDLRGTEAIVEACGCTLEEAVVAWAEGWLLGQYTFDKYKRTKADSPVESLHFVVEDEKAAGLKAALRIASIRAQGTALAREWCNEPVNRMNPEILASRVEEHFRGSQVEVTVYSGDALAEHGMNGLLTVGQGSQYGPAMIQMRYVSDGSQPLTALIGKGITFDMGGMNVKTGRDLSEARFDMGGACGVIGAMHILSELGAKANIVALIPTSDNVPDAKAFLPSTIIEYPNGLTVQVGNTDAEGRLVLADALLHAQRLGAAEIVDMATLTGSVGQALGLRMAGVWGDKAGAELLHELGERNGDRNWPMPLITEDEELLRSDYADLNNIGSSPYGGAIQAALFLARFVERSVKWNHIDMANTVQAKGTAGYYPAGASGYGARLLADYITARAEEQRNVN
ncbi:leucyl aminopeptidase family protein [Paenibacillus sp. LHD-117]|uniref:leucyl aminopeptidase family protein n=1 Tax=Paenibacillus sp. LHD-117 TaxID=3071412 RepID=UPI0027E15330|nr:leucyl aminopeptidase family protein [Paenibacillus sp. LHD-117]MDQ6422730.1 leucyl aminopeptidase family protein [Paenibacillus sp. LHD-117]